MEIQRFRVEKNTDYTTINNTIIKDKTISLKAKGLFLTIMSLPDTWDFSVNGIVTILKEERRAIYAAINELIERGYCQRSRFYENGKVKYWYYSFTEKPQANLDAQNLLLQNLQVENLDVENDTQLNKELIKEEKNKVNTQYSGRTTLNKSGKTFNQITNQPESIPEPEQDALNELQIRGLLTALNQDRWRIAIEQLELKGLDLSRFTEYLNYLASDKYSWRKAKLSPDFVVQEIADFLTETTPLNPMEQYYVTDQSGEKYFHPIFASKKLKRGPQEELKQFLQRQRQVQTGKLKIYDAKQLEMALC